MQVVTRRGWDGKLMRGESMALLAHKARKLAHRMHFNLSCGI